MQSMTARVSTPPVGWKVSNSRISATAEANNARAPTTGNNPMVSSGHKKQVALPERSYRLLFVVPNDIALITVKPPWQRGRGAGVKHIAPLLLPKALSVPNEIGQGAWQHRANLPAVGWGNGACHALFQLDFFRVKQNLTFLVS